MVPDSVFFIGLKLGTWGVWSGCFTFAAPVVLGTTAAAVATILLVWSLQSRKQRLGRGDV